MSRVYGTVRYRLLSRLIIDPDTGCLRWTATINHDGYGVMGVGGKIRKVHRIMWEMFEGPIPDGLELDHLCGQRNCASIAHLELVTHAENIRRGFAHNGNKTHCKRGHPFDEANTAFNGRARQCITCRRMRSAGLIPPRAAAASP